MKTYFLYPFLLFFIFYNSRGVAQNTISKTQSSIFDALTEKNPGEGAIRIRQPRFIKYAVGVTKGINSHTSSRSENSVSRVGYRIQVYNGNLAVSKEEAYNRAKRINEVSPNTTCYVTYKAPFWRLMVGDYRSREDANVKLKELKVALPDLSRDMYIVRNKIRSY